VSELVIRPAREDDLSAVFAVGLRAEHEQHLLETLDLNHIPSVLRHAFNTGDMRVAKRDGEIIGTATSLLRGDLRYLAGLFVVPEAQQRGVGRALLAAVMPHDGRPQACTSSGDPRALAAYTRHGMVPLWPFYVVRRPVQGMQTLAWDEVEVIEASPDDPEIVAWDGRSFGRPRPQDLAFLRRDRDGRPFWLRRAGKTIGYAFINQLYRGSDAIFYGGERTVSVGPLGVADAAQAAVATLSAMKFATQFGGEVMTEIMGPHPAFGPLLAAGFQIREIQTFMASDPAKVGDPTLYVPMSGAHG
jgi:GNAT superfamily N-acetyltransferase